MRDDDQAYTRKGFFGEFFSAFKKGVSNHLDRKIAKVLEAPIRPPGALEEVEFLAACTRCKACVEACPPHAIRLMPIGGGVAAGSPYLEPRIQPCQLCDGFPCIAACGDGALLPVPRPENVTMGSAIINTESCQTWDNKVCSLCYDACPFPERAIMIDEDFHPQILDACVGCGLCEKACPVTPVGVKTLSPVNYRAWRVEDELYFGLVEKDEHKP